MDIFLKHKKIFALTFFLIIGLAIYGNSFDNQLFWDDDDNIINNVYIKDWRYLPNFFTESLISGAGQVSNYWRPLLLMSFAIDYRLWGLAPFGFHLTNVLLHLIAAWLIFLLLNKLIRIAEPELAQSEPVNLGRWFMDKSIWLPFLVSLLFLIHSVQTEAITYVAGRADPLSSVFCLLAIYYYVLYKQSNHLWQYGASLVFFLFGLLTKEQVILLPLLLILVEVVFFSKTLDKKVIIKALKLSLPFLVVAAAYFTLRITILNFNDILHGFTYDAVYSNSVWLRLLTFCSVMLGYFKLLFIPANLQMAREVAMVNSFFSWPVIVFILLMALIFWLGLKTWAKDRLIAFGLLWFFIILLPRTNILQINRPMYEHWLYLPLMGFWLALICLAALFYKKIKNNNPAFGRKLFYAGLALITVYILFLGFLTIKRNQDWQNPIIFYKKNLAYTPNSFIQHNNLGMAYAAAGRLADSVAEYQTAIKIQDVYPQAHYNLANSLRDLGRLDEALAEYEKAILISPSFQAPYNNLLAIYLSQNDRAKAEDVLERAKREFDEFNYYYIAGAVYYNFGDYDQAIKLWRQALELNQDNLQLRLMIDQARQKKNLK